MRVRLERGEVRRVRWPLADEGRGGAARGRWTERRGALLVVEGGGQRGAGEASPLPGFGGADDGAAERAAADLEAFVRALPLVVDGERALAEAARLAAGAGEPAARFAIEAAVLDVVSRARGMSLAALLGGANAAPRVARVVDDAAGAARAWSDGLRTLKVKARDELDELAAIVRAAPGARVRVDVNQGWPLAEVDARLAAVAAAAGDALEYVEEPAAGLAPRLVGPRVCPLALDESLAEADKDEWLDGVLASGAVVALVLKPTMLGGVAASVALAARARARGVDAVASHALEGPVAMAAVVALARALGGPRAHGIDPHAALPGWSAE